MSENTSSSNSTASNASNEVATKAEAPQSTGRTTIEDTVVGKIAGIAAREVSGVYALGGGAARMMGKVRDTFGAGENIQQGISVEVGEKQAAVDISIVAEYGVAIHELAEAIRRNVIRSIERMTGLEVTEVNVAVTDVHLPQDDNSDEDETPAEAAEEKAPRVQ